MSVPVPEYTIADLPTLHALGLSDQQIGAALELSPNYIRKVRCRLGLPVWSTHAHGSHAGFNGHRSRGEEPCLECWEAERRYQREQKRARRARLAA